jgi:hypothetical protein
MGVAHRIKTPMEVQNIFPTWLCDIHTHFNSITNKDPLAQAKQTHQYKNIKTKL